MKTLGKKIINTVKRRADALRLWMMEQCNSARLLKLRNGILLTALLLALLLLLLLAMGYYYGENYGMPILVLCGASIFLGLLSMLLTHLQVWKMQEERVSITEANKQYRAEKRRRRKREHDLATSMMLSYNLPEQNAVTDYILRAFGTVGPIFFDMDNDKLHTHILVTMPCKERNYYTLITNGLGAYQMNVPSELREHNRAFAELTMLLPPDWDLLHDSWPFHVLKETARNRIDEQDMIFPGNIYRRSVPPQSGFAGMLVMEAYTKNQIPPHIYLPGGKLVNYYMLVPILKDEWDYAFARRSSWQLWQRLRAHHERTLVVNPGRSSCVNPDTWFEEDIAPFCWGTSEHSFHLTMEINGWLSERFEEYGMSGSGTEWGLLAKEFLRRFQRKNMSMVDIDCNETVFFVSSEDEEILRRFALQFRDLCENEELMSDLIAEL